MKWVAATTATLLLCSVPAAELPPAPQVPVINSAPVKPQVNPANVFPGYSAPVSPSLPTADVDGIHNTGSASVDKASVSTRADDVPGDEPVAVGPPALVDEDVVPVPVRSLLSVIVPGKNDARPVWSPDGSLLSFERSVNGKQEIMISRPDGTVIKKIYYKSASTKTDIGLALLLPELAQASESFNANLAWSPQGDRFVFMSNAGEGNYDLYVDGVNDDATARLTDSSQKDGQPHWSPIGNEVVFVSGRSGNALVYTMNLATRELKPVTTGLETYLYPRWSPEGKRISVMYGSNSNHDILMISGMDDGAHTVTSLIDWSYDDISPTWSPDGTKVAFYSNYNSRGDTGSWSIMVLDAVAGANNSKQDLIRQVVVEDVVPDVASGPAWMPDSQHIAYVKNEKHDYNPIYIADISTHKSRKLFTGTTINHDLNISVHGVLAFRAQVDQWDHIFLAELAGVKL